MIDDISLIFKVGKDKLKENIEKTIQLNNNGISPSKSTINSILKHDTVKHSKNNNNEFKMISEMNYILLNEYKSLIEDGIYLLNSKKPIYDKSSKILLNFHKQLNVISKLFEGEKNLEELYDKLIIEKNFQTSNKNIPQKETFTYISKKEKIESLKEMNLKLNQELTNIKLNALKEKDEKEKAIINSKEIAESLKELLLSINPIKAENQKLKEEMRTLTEKNNQIHNDNISTVKLRKELDERDEKIKNMQRLGEKLNEEIAKKENIYQLQIKTNEEMSKQYSIEKQANQKLMQSVIEEKELIITEFKDFKSQFEKINKEKEKLTTKINEQTKTINDLQNELELKKILINKDSSEKLKELTNMNSSFQKEISEKTQHIYQLNDSIQSIQKELSNSKLSIDTLKKNIEILLNKNKSLEENALLNDNKLKDQNSKINSLISENEVNKEEIELLTKINNEYTNYKQKFDKDISNKTNLAKELEKFKEDRELNEKAIQEMENELNKVKNQKEEISQKLGLFNQQILFWKEKCEKCEKESKIKKDQYEMLDRNYSKLKENNENLIKEKEELAKLIEEKESNKDSFKYNIINANNLKSQNNNLIGNLEEKERKIQSLTQNLELIQREKQETLNKFNLLSNEVKNFFNKKEIITIDNIKMRFDIKSLSDLTNYISKQNEENLKLFNEISNLRQKLPEGNQIAQTQFKHFNTKLRVIDTEKVISFNFNASPPKSQFTFGSNYSSPSSVNNAIIIQQQNILPQNESFLQDKIKKLEENYNSAKELISSLKQNNEQTTKLLSESIDKNKRLEQQLKTKKDSLCVVYKDSFDKLKKCIMSLIKEISPNIIPIEFTLGDQKIPIEKYIHLIESFKDNLSKNESKRKRYKESINRLNKMLNDKKKEIQNLLTIQSEILEKYSKREEDFEDYKEKVNVLINFYQTNSNSKGGISNINGIPKEKYEQTLIKFMKEEEKYKKELATLRKENEKMQSAIENSSHFNVLNESFTSNSSISYDNNSNILARLNRVSSQPILNENHHNKSDIKMFEKKLEESEKLFSEQLAVIKEELKKKRKELETTKKVNEDTLAILKDAFDKIVSDIKKTPVNKQYLGMIMKTLGYTDMEITEAFKLKKK